MTLARVGYAMWWFLRPFVLLAAVLVILWVLLAAGLSLEWIVAGALLWVLPVFVGYRLHLSKNRDSPIVLAVLLGWIGVLFALALPAAGHQCPWCAETIRREATVCRHCGRDV